MNSSQFFKPLLNEDIEEKIKINIEKHGYDLMGLKEMLEFELALVQRDILAFINRGEMISMGSHIQAQNLREQIAYINNKIIKDLLKCQQPTQPQS